MMMPRSNAVCLAVSEAMIIWYWSNPKNHKKKNDNSRLIIKRKMHGFHI